jgi:hypothetical protein
MFIRKKDKTKDAAISRSTDQAEGDLKIDEVWIVPCGLRPDKPSLKNPEIRLAMT